MGEGFFSGFPGYKDQSALSFLKGRSSRFLHFYAVRSIMSRQEIFLYLTSVWLRFVFFLFYKASEFSNIFGYYCERCLPCGEDFSLLFFCSLLFCKWCVFYALLSCLLFVYFGCAGSVGIFWRAGSYTFSVCNSAMWSAGPVQFYLGILLERMAGLYRFFFLSGSVCSGYGTVEMVGGGGPFFSAFFSLLSVFFAVGCLR